MRFVRSLTIGGAVLLLLGSVGCCTASKHKQEECAACESGPVYYYDAMPPGSGPMYYPSSPTPIAPPQPGPPPTPLPPVPAPPTGSAERPSRWQSMRNATGEFFRSANNNLHSFFSRNDEAMVR